MKRQDEQSTERRRYIRLETVFPVEFQVCSSETGRAISNLRQGFTRNVSEGGICLEVNELENGLVKEMYQPASRLALFINLPHHNEPVSAHAEVKWNKKTDNGFPNRCLFGLEYVDIKDDIRKEIIGYAKKLRRRPKLIIASIILLITACAGLIWQLHSAGTKRGITERQLLSLGGALTKSYEQRISLENKLYALNIKRQKLDREIRESRQMVDSLEKRLSKMTDLGSDLSDELTIQKLTLEGELTQWKSERETLLRQLDKLSISRESLAAELARLREIGSAKIIRVHLTNDSSVIGQLLDLTGERLYIKIGLGSIGIERAMIAGVNEVPDTQKIDIQEEWKRQEEEAKKDAEKYKRFIDMQREKGLVYFNGQWIKKEDAEKIEKDLRQKEEEVFAIIARQSMVNESKQPLVETLLQKESMPVISIKDNRIYLNGRLFFIKGVGYGIEYPGTSGSIDTYKKVPFSVFEKDFQMMQKAGINTIRTYEPLPSRLLDLAERCGIMVIENICYPSANTDFDSRVHLDILKEQIRKYVSRDKDRKCILMWSVWSDAPWAWGPEGNVVQRYEFTKVNNFLKELYNTVKQYDISHPVTAGNAIGLNGERLGWDFLDVIGLNLYLGGFDWFIESQAQKNIAEIKAIEVEYKKPVLILETGFSTFVKGQDQSEILEKQIKIASTNVSGITIFQWADGWQKAGDKDTQDEHIEEHWGILDGYRNPKPGYKTVFRLFNSIKTESYGYESHVTESGIVVIPKKEIIHPEE